MSPAQKAWRTIRANKAKGTGWDDVKGRGEPDTLDSDSEVRKNTPIFSGVLNYFPLALAAVARMSKRGNDKHNPGKPLHWARGKSTDHEDCIARHLIDVNTRAANGEYEHAMALAWRALAKLQELEEQRLGKGHSRGSRVEALCAPIRGRISKRRSRR